MACKNARRRMTIITQPTETIKVQVEQTPDVEMFEKMLFGVDSKQNAELILQNNINLFEWVVRNKLYPNFWGRNLIGENCLTEKEIDFLHSMGCKIAPIYNAVGEKRTEEQGEKAARKIDDIAIRLDIARGTAIFLEIDAEELVTRDYMLGFAKGLLEQGFIPAFRANTDAKYEFDHEFSRGMQTHKDIFSKCLIWAVSPSLAEYERVTTTHLIHPDNWAPFAPSGIVRDDIAVWQYGKDCHPINDDNNIETSFNINLIKNPQVIIEKMF